MHYVNKKAKERNNIITNTYILVNINTETHENKLILGMN